MDDAHTQIFVMLFDPSPDGREIEQPEDPPFAHLGSLLTPEGEHEMTSFPSQDKMAWETQGAVCDRTQEHTGSTDLGITLYRKMLRDQIEIVRRGGEPMALVRDPEKNRIISFAGSQPLLK
jgi:5,5'-dehydrodivanillate O-demethylase